MSAPTIQTPLSYEDALGLAEPVCPVAAQRICPPHRVASCGLCVNIARTLQAVDVASRAQAVPDYQRLADLVAKTEEATRGTADVRERLALIPELVLALGQMVSLVVGTSAEDEEPYRVACALLAKVPR